MGTWPPINTDEHGWFFGEFQSEQTRLDRFVVAEDILIMVAEDILIIGYTAGQRKLGWYGRKLLYLRVIGVLGDR